MHRGTIKNQAADVLPQLPNHEADEINLKDALTEPTAVQANEAKEEEEIDEPRIVSDVLNTTASGRFAASKAATTPFIEQPTTGFLA